jgi:hypothetical protein
METQKISRENLKEIHKVACPTWQKKLEEYALRDVFSSSVELTSEEVDEMFNTSDAKQKEILSKFLTQPKNIMNEINSFEDACIKLEITQSAIETIKILSSLPNGYKLIAFYKLEIIIKALNDGWYPNFENHNEYKYFNWFKLNDGVFSCYCTYYTYSNMYVPSALYLKSNDLAVHCAKIAFEEYKTFYK